LDIINEIKVMKNKLNIWHISDTHTFHDMLTVPENIDMVIFSGDCSNPRESLANSFEVLKFLKWFGELPIKYKIFVAGNHDTSIERKIIFDLDFGDNIIHLWDSEVTIEGLKIWGSPYTPSFGFGWAFNKDRSKIYKVWEQIPEDVDIIVTHGPPKGILDLSYDRDNKLEICGDLALKKRIKEIQPKLVCFGHIHNCDNITNQGYIKLADHDTIYSNGSIVTDGKFGRINNNGNIFEISK
jgi:Icc-related predicted phosphoesterase